MARKVFDPSTFPRTGTLDETVGRQLPKYMIYLLDKDKVNYTYAAVFDAQNGERLTPGEKPGTLTIKAEDIMAVTEKIKKTETEKKGSLQFADKTMTYTTSKNYLHMEKEGDPIMICAHLHGVMPWLLVALYRKDNKTFPKDFKKALGIKK